MSSASSPSPARSASTGLWVRAATQRWPGHYALPFLSTALALGAARLLAPTFNDAPVPLFLVSVMFSSWYGGLWPGVLATVLGAATLGQFFNLSLGAQVLASEDTAFDLALFIVVALLITALNARLRRLNTRLAAARAEAERATRAREEILGVVAHDLKSPLTSISMGAQVTSRWLAQSSGCGHSRTSWRHSGR